MRMRHRAVASLNELRGDATFLLQLYYRKDPKLLTIRVTFITINIDPEDFINAQIQHVI